MDRCLNEAVFLRVYTREGTSAERSHLRLCADCAERYDQLVEDLETIGRALDAPPPLPEAVRAWPSRRRWMPAAAACTVLIALVVGSSWLWRPSPAGVASRAARVETFTADLSGALFPTDDAPLLQLAAEAPDIEAALEAGQPCTGNRFLSGECNDQVSAFAADTD